MSNTFLWKPISDTTGNLVVLTPEKFNFSWVEYNGEKITNGTRNGKNGNRQHWRFRHPGSAYPSKKYFKAVSPTEEVNWLIPNSSRRYETQEHDRVPSPPPPVPSTYIDSLRRAKAEVETWVQFFDSELSRLSEEPPPPAPPPAPTPPGPGTPLLWAGPTLMLSGNGIQPGAWGYPNPLWFVKPHAIVGNSNPNVLVQCNPVDKGMNIDPSWNADVAASKGCLGVYLDMEAGHSGNGFDLRLHARFKAACDSRNLLFIGGPKMFGQHFKENRHGAGAMSDRDYAQHMQSVTHGLAEWNYNRSQATPTNIVNWYDTLRSNGYNGQYWPMALHPKGEYSGSPWLTEAEGHALIRHVWTTRSLYIGHFYPQYEQGGMTQRWANTCRELYK